MPKIDLEQIYHAYTCSENDKSRSEYKEKYRGWYTASSAGSCYKKQLLRLQGKEGPRPDKRIQRLLRLGTIVHKDFENAIEWHLKHTYPNDDELDYEIYSEHRVELPEIKVTGTLDIAVENNGSLDIYDVKTVASYKWRKQFGHLKNRDKNPSVNYELQIGTYAIGMANQVEADPDKIFMYLAWYNKDNSTMKIKEVPTFWIDNAFEYWTDLIEKHENIGHDPDKMIHGEENIPVASWECKYCEFQGLYCEGVPSNR